VFKRFGLVLMAAALPVGLLITSSGVASATPPAPTVSAVVPHQGPTTGGTKVFVAGTDFTFDATVAFGKTAATKVKVESDNLLIATSPAESVGTVDIIVTTAVGSSTATPHDAFTFNINAPVVERVFPNHGRVSGGTVVLIKGQHFTKTPTVDFGTVPAASVIEESNHLILAKTPAEPAGTVDVIVTTAVGPSVPTSKDAFTFVTPGTGSGSTLPVVKTILHRQGPVTGGTTVYVLGRRFTKASTVTFGTTPAASVTVESSHIIIVTSPVEPAGTVDVVVTTTAGSSTPTPKDVFTFS